MSKPIEKLNWPLMENNITQEDLDCLINFLKSSPRLTQGEQVRLFEKEWSEWVGMKYSVLVNSGSSANMITLAALKELFGGGEIICPPLTWVSDIASILQCGFKPVFADIDSRTLGMAEEQILSKITPETKAVFLTHILGFNALTRSLLDALEERKIVLIEDACESHGAVFDGQKVGSYGLISNFSFYYAHHLSTVEGGMVCTNDEAVYQMLRMFRSHGLVRESDNEQLRGSYAEKYPDLNPQFIFAYPAYNVRSSEMNAVLGRSQLTHLDREIIQRRENLEIFLSNLDSKKYRTDFKTEGNSNYAFTLVLQKGFKDRVEKVMEVLTACKVEFRRGTSGGGNQLRQPYLRRLFAEHYRDFPEADFIHFYGFYIGNFPDLDREKIKRLCAILNRIE